MDTRDFSEDIKSLTEMHGHLCPGSAIGYRVSRYALRLLDRGPGLYVYTAGEGCPLHAIEIFTGCSKKNGTVIAADEPGWGFYHRVCGEGYRFTLKKDLQLSGSDRDSYVKVLLSLPDNDLFDVSDFEPSGRESGDGN